MYSTYIMKQSEAMYKSGNIEKVTQKNKFKIWLQKILLLLMYKINFLQDEELRCTDTDRIEIKYDKVYELIEEKIHHEIYMRWSRSEDFILVIGYKYFKELNIEDVEYQLNFLMHYNRNGSEGRMYQDIEVILEPTLDGVLLLKKERR